jgi:hypothetical protein
LKVLRAHQVRSPPHDFPTQHLRFKDNTADGEAQEEDVRFVCSAQKKVVFRQVELIPKTTVKEKPPIRSSDMSALRDAVEEEPPAFYVTTTGPDGKQQQQ